VRDAELVGCLGDREDAAAGVWWGAPLGSGQASLLTQDRGDLVVGVVRSELADQLDRVLAGARGLGAAANERDLQLGMGAALPDDLDLGTPRVLSYGDDDLADEGSQQSLRSRGLSCRPSIDVGVRGPGA
jgi:hypothetical protein